MGLWPTFQTIRSQSEYAGFNQTKLLLDGTVKKGMLVPDTILVRIPNDFYEYDVKNNSWTVKPMSPEWQGDMVLLLAIMVMWAWDTNDTTYLTDFYQYDPINSQWSTVAKHRRC